MSIFAWIGILMVVKGLGNGVGYVIKTTRDCNVQDKKAVMKNWSIICKEEKVPEESEDASRS